MTAIAENRTLQYRGYLWSTWNASSNDILKGVLVNVVNGVVINATDTASHEFAGVSRNVKDNDNLIDLFGIGLFQFNQDGSFSSATDEGTDVYILDNQTVTDFATSTNKVHCGRLVKFISSSEVLISIDANSTKVQPQTFIVDATDSISSTAGASTVNITAIDEMKTAVETLQTKLNLVLDILENTEIMKPS